MGIYYTGTIFHDNVYIIEKEDLIADGVGGADSIANVQNSESTSYLMKYKGEVIVGTGSPSGNYGMRADHNTPNNVLYLDQTSASFWKPTVVGSSITSWTNITKNVVLNIKGLRLNSNGDDTKYNQLAFELNEEASTPELGLRDINGNPTNMEVGKITYDSATTMYNRLGYLNDADLLSNFIVEKQSDNTNGGFRAKHFSSGTIENDSLFSYDIISNTWKALRQDGSSLKVNIGGMVVNGLIVREFEDDLMIQNQSEFDAMFNKDIDGGKTIISLTNIESSVIIKPGVYELRNRLEFAKSYRIKCMEGAWIKLHGSLRYNTENSKTQKNKMFYSIYNENFNPAYYGGFYKFPKPPYGPFPFYKPRYNFQAGYDRQHFGDWYVPDKSIFVVVSNNVELNLNVDFRGVILRNLIEITDRRKITIRLKIKEAKCDALIFSNTANNNNEIYLALDDTFNEEIRHKYNFYNISNAYVSGNFTTPQQRSFYNCKNCIVHGVWDSKLNILAGDFDV